MNKHIATALAASALLAMPVLAEDQGAAIAVAAQEGTAAVSVPQENFVDAELKVKEQLKALGLNPEGGYDRKKKAIIAIGVASLDTKKSPAGDDSFMVARSAKATEAYLMAKADIIQFFYTEVDAQDRVAFNDGNVSEEEQNLKTKIEEIKEKVAVFAEKAGKPELADADFDENLVAALRGIELAPPPPKTSVTADGVALDDADGNRMTADQVTVTEEPAAGTNLASERDALAAEIHSAIKEANDLPKVPMNEIDSSAKLLSKMPLLGAKILTEAESWDKTEKRYQIAMAVIWSPKLQEEAKNLAIGNPTVSEKKGKFSVQEWIERQDLLAMAGPWSFTDNEGKTIVIGIAARDIANLSSPKEKGKRLEADTDARVAVANSLVCDLAAFTETSKNLKEYEDGSYEAMQNLANTVSSQTKVALSGLGRLASKVGYHPITGRKTYAVAFFIEPEVNKEAMELIKRLYADAITVNNATKFKQGQMAGMEATYEEAKASDAKFEEGKAGASSDVSGRVRAAEVNVKTSGPQGSSGKNQIGEKGGVVSGVDLDTVDLDF